MTSNSLISRKQKRFLRRGVGGALMRAFGPGFVRALSRTWRTEVFGLELLGVAERADPNSKDSSKPGCMIALWHGRMLVGVEYGRKSKWSILVSPSADGEISERMLRAFGYHVVRGSSSRGGARALREMLTLLRGGNVVVLTPDGPRGPRHSMNPGLAWMARATGFPIVPFGLVANRAWHLSSWDAFTIPKPFARVALVYGEPVHVAREASESELEAATELIRARLFECERRGLQHLGASEDL
ncbi:MAG TPA: lysophospholipid acyltransferase family protein [Planctomycetota bacterium]|nr:lysophospholipid acyltransferase family protein [Planctomycetota bacterium]